MTRMKHQTGWLGLAVAVAVVSALVMFAPWGAAQADSGPRLPDAPHAPAAPAWGRLSGSQRFFSDDLTVEGGQTLDGDVAVASGDVVVEGGGRIDGSLVVYSGDIEIRSGGAVDGDVTAVSGDVIVAGEVDGDVASISGNVSLRDGARVSGDISVMSGDVEQAEGAQVDGDIVQGPRVRIPRIGNGVFTAPVVAGRPVSFFGWLGQLLLRLIGAALQTAVVTLVVGVLAYARPELVTSVRTTMRENPALSFVVGLLANLTLLFLAGLLAVTVCLLPIALIPMLLLVAANVVGWAAVSQVVGERVSTGVKQPVQPALQVVLGAVLLTGAASLLWAFGGCFRAIGFLGVLVVSSFGTGALLVPWLNRRNGGAGRRGAVGVPPSGPSSGPEAGGEPVTRTSPVVTTTPRHRETGAVDMDVAAPLDYVTAEEVNLAHAHGSMETLPETQGTPEDHTLHQGPKPVQEARDLDVGQPLDYLTGEEVNAAARAGMSRTAGPVGPAEDDFTIIKGIGPVFDRRLKEAGIRTFADLAAAPVERIAEIVGWPLDRVTRDDIPGQARHFSENR